MRPTKRQTLHLSLLLGPVTVFLGIFFIGPLTIMLIYSFLEPGLYGGVEWSFYHHNFGRILGWADGEWEDYNPVYIRIFLQSIELALITVFFSLLVCYPAAYWVSRLPDQFKPFFIFMITLPFFVSLIVRLYAWMLILRPSGFLNTMLELVGFGEKSLDLMFSSTAVIIGMVYVMVPFMFLPIYASLEKLDMSLVDASSDLGANKFQTFRRVIVPLTLPGVVGGSIIVFIPSLGNFVIPDLLGGAKVVMIGNLVEQSFLYARNWPFGSALAMLIMSTVLAFLLIYMTWMSRGQTVENIRG
ncbi:MAG: ABC transporter permease [Rhodospirillales bacterium]|jgi:spermidine/putrescine transport system permease protein|nr:ABC transporter permease [Rhodospirillales bacterium]MBT4627595.1 ABC transporter permease [Rhodospirillales bacterium]MBT6110842.1 ABC transporter permease [Rhodospirillales bacterium]MBT6824781.1 ABC transporter permease [Rhodospirillales bacterium]